MVKEKRLKDAFTAFLDYVYGYMHVSGDAYGGSEEV